MIHILLFLLQEKIEIQNKYQSHFIENGRYNKEIALNMGDEYYFGRFNSVEDAIEFKNYIQDKQ